MELVPIDGRLLQINCQHFVLNQKSENPFEIMKTSNHSVCVSRTKILSSMTVAMAAACLMIGANPTEAQVINFDYPGGGSSVNGQTPANYSGQGAFSDTGNNYWNPVVPNGTTSGGL